MDESFQTYLAAIMARRGLTQREVAERADMEAPTLNRILAAKYRYRPVRTIERLAKAVSATSEERIELYRLGGLIPPEILEAFCSSSIAAKSLWKQSQKWIEK